MKTNLIKTSANTHISFISKATGQSAEKLKISVFDSSDNLIFEKRNFSQENFENTDWVLAKPNLIAIEVTDEKNILSLEYFIIYDDSVLSNGVTYLDIRKESIAIIGAGAMSAHYSENIYRPQIHFTAFKRWINDPNGLVYSNGLYHMFYQYYPHTSVWGNMHWGHAVSKDAVHWKHLPIALYPRIEDKFFGGAFSGSAIEKDGKIVVIYTHHFEDARNKEKFHNTEFIENQEVAETINGIDFVLWDAPVLRCEGRTKEISRDFRDPKVWLDTDNKYKMLLGSAYNCEPAILIYSSDDLKDWTFEGTLYIEKNIKGRCIECPDLFPLGNKYVMIASIIEMVDGKEKHVTRYHIGQYKNNKFISEGNEIIDFGPSFYAIQTFEDHIGRMGIAWLDSWQDTKKSTAVDFAGAMSIPIRMSLDGSKLKMTPIETLEKLRTSKILDINNISNECVETILNDGTFELKLKLQSSSNSNGQVKIQFSTQSPEEYVSFTIDFGKKNVSVEIKENDRLSVCNKDIDIKDNSLDMHMYFDRSSIESFFADYSARGSFRFYWCSNVKKMTIASNNIKIQSLTTYKLKTIWED